ncbi:unnamed protein product [Urochloa decumbens]|uniref:DUF295 domain-containing protein n=1 Tax=Urochloa decumbens TaxID=240449 RepID=A0ABC9BHI2_9POAL
MGIVALPPSWEELPPDLLGLVLHRLPSLDDRVRLRAVCRPWRAGAHPQRHKPLPPPLPWFALRDGALVDLQGAQVRCGPILRKGVSRYLAVGDLAFLVHDDGAGSLMYPLSGFTLPLPQLAPAVRRALDESKAYRRSNIVKTHCKAILSSPLDSTTEPFIAVLMMEGHGLAASACKQPYAISAGVPDPESTRRIYDIASFTGSSMSSPIMKAFMPWSLMLDDLASQNRHQVECSGKLLMIRRWMSYPGEARLGDHDRTFRFEVFEADLATIPGRWINVDSLDGHAIFLDSECSKSVLASKCAGGVQEDCIYFMHRIFDHPTREYFGPCVDPFRDSGVYSMRDAKITPLLPEAVMVELRCKQQYLTWFFPTGA